jgi:hypothetical protein
VSRVTPSRRALAIGFATFALVAAATPAPADEGGTQLSLATDYLVHPVDVDAGPFGAHTLRLSISVDDKGGKGRLGIDPNTTRFNVYGDETGYTEIATRSIDVTVSAVEREDPTSKGRRLYEIKAEGLKGRLFLVLAREKTGTHRLLLADTDGTVRQVFPLRGAAKDK